jgi:hypothetical protein
MSGTGRVTMTIVAMAWAVTGILAGHELTYALLFPDAHVHHAVLAETGHGWLHWLWPVALAAGLVSVALGLLSGSSRGGSRGVRFAVLALLQVTLFCGLELSERLAVELTPEPHHHGLVHQGLAAILIVGGLIQLVTAWFGSAASRLVQAVAARLRGTAPVRPGARSRPLVATRTLPSVQPAPRPAIRGPPMVIFS